MDSLSYEEALSLPSPVFVDLRSPVEFRQDRIPGSINFPVFTDSERAEIGTLYHLSGGMVAIRKGTEIVGGRLGEMVDFFQRFHDSDVVLYCARGGMRSGTVASLMNSLGIRVVRLRQGYREYRRYVLERIGTIEIRNLFVLHGLTGTGKTEIIRRMPCGIDLEAMAGHRSSVFGGMGLSPGSQKFFESLLVMQAGLSGNFDYSVIEGESRKIGNLHLPERLLRAMHAAPGILITAPLERRVEIIMREYLPRLDIDETTGIVRSIEGRIGRKNVDDLLLFLERGRMEEFVTLLLEKYYDPRYAHSICGMTFIAQIENTGTGESIRALDEIVKSHVQPGHGG